VRAATYAPPPAALLLQVGSHAAAPLEKKKEKSDSVAIFFPSAFTRDFFLYASILRLYQSIKALLRLYTRELKALIRLY